jgi:putative oxidoreductase
MQSYTKFQNVALLATRLIIAVIFLYAGYMKFSMWSMEPSDMMPAWMLYLMQFLSIVEPLGAVAVLIGFLTRWASLGLAIIMVGAIVIMKFMMNAAFFTMPQAPGLDMNALLLVACLVLVAFGAGDWSVEKLWKKSPSVVTA